MLRGNVTYPKLHSEVALVQSHVFCPLACPGLCIEGGVCIRLGSLCTMPLCWDLVHALGNLWQESEGSLHHGTKASGWGCRPQST